MHFLVVSVSLHLYQSVKILFYMKTVHGVKKLGALLYFTSELQAGKEANEPRVISSDVEEEKKTVFL